MSSRGVRGGGSARSAEKLEKLEYDPIPSEHERGYTALSIYLPGTFFAPGRRDYAVFVGGNGHGTRASLAEAERWLLKRAVAYCERRIQEAQATAEHYADQRDRLVRNGLRRAS